MKIPLEVLGSKKIRDSRILRLYLDGNTMSSIGSSIGLTESRIQQILYRNRNLLNSDAQYERAKRINWLKRQIQRSGDSNKDSSDLLEQMKKEMEGESALIDNSQHTHITYAWNNNNDKIQPSELPRGDPQRQS